MIVSSSLIRNSTWVRSEFWQISKLDVQLWFSHRLLFKLIALVVVRVDSISQSHPLVPEWSPHVTMLDSTKCHVLPYLTWPWRTPPPSAPSTRRRSSSASAFLPPTQPRPCSTWKSWLENQSKFEMIAHKHLWASFWLNLTLYFFKFFLISLICSFASRVGGLLTPTVI